MFKERVDLPLCSESKVASDYLQKRKLNPNHFYFSEDFSAFVKSFKEVEFDNLYKESRIVIPIHYQKKLVGFQGRALSPNSIKYITIMLNDDAPKIYGLDQIKKDESVYVTEGPFDSTFVCNAITTAEIQEILIRSASDLIDLDHPNYQYVAARLLLFAVRKQIYGKMRELPSLENHIIN